MAGVEGCAIFTYFLIILALIGGCITILVFDILALKDISPSEVHELCPESAMWWYILVTLILSFLSSITSSKNSNSSDDDKKKQGAILNSFLLGIVMFVWGCIEIWGVDCVDELHGTLLYRMSLVHVFIGIAGTAFSLFFMLLMCGLICCK